MTPTKFDYLKLLKQGLTHEEAVKQLSKKTIDLPGNPDQKVKAWLPQTSKTSATPEPYAKCGYAQKPQPSHHQD